MIQSPSKEVTVIVYDTPKPPKYYRLNKSFIRTLLIAIPLLTIFSISVSLLYSIFLKNKISRITSSEPQRILDLQEVIQKQKSDIDVLSKTNALITEKLSKGTGSETSVSALGLFTVPVGIQDLRAKELVKIEQVELKSEGAIKLSFNLENNSPNGEKLSGYLNVIQFQGNLIQYYPNTELPQKNLRLEYSEGESFGFTRFRPTEAIFENISKKSAKYKIFIFSRTGDLLAYKQLGPFNID